MLTVGTTELFCIDACHYSMKFHDLISIGTKQIIPGVTHIQCLLLTFLFIKLEHTAGLSGSRGVTSN